MIDEFIRPIDVQCGVAIPHDPNAKVWFIPGKIYYTADHTKSIRVIYRQKRNYNRIHYKWMDTGDIVPDEIRPAKIFLMDGVECIKTAYFAENAPIYRADQPEEEE